MTRDEENQELLAKANARADELRSAVPVEDRLAIDLARMMLKITTSYKGQEKLVAEMLTNSLAAYVSIASREPKAALRSVARSMLAFNYSAMRAAHFGYTKLGIKTESGQLPVEDNVVQMGDPREKPR